MHRLLYILTCSILVACQPTLLAEFEDKPVVSCYLEPGVSPTLQVQKLIALRDDVEYSDENVDDLQITITNETKGESYSLQSLGEGKYQNLSLVVVQGDEYSLEFTYNDKLISSSTSVPTAPQDVVFSATSIDVSSHGGPMGDSNIDITWLNSDEGYYIVEGYTESTTLVDEYNNSPSQSIRLSSTQGDLASLSREDFHYEGEYQISLCHINYEYVLLSQGTGSSSSDLVDIKGNIDGGYGIFTGINRVVQSIRVY